MAESIWEAGKLRAVYQPAGSRGNGERRYRRANYDLLEWASSNGGTSELYVVPLGLVRMGAADTNVTGAADAQLGQEFGYYSQESVISDLHEGSGGDDTWKALHSFGYV